MIERLSNFVRDPSSNQFSASRLCLMIVVLVFWPCVFIVEFTGHKMGMWSDLVKLTAALATIYTANSAAGAFSRFKYSGEIEKVPVAPEIEKG